MAIQGKRDGSERQTGDHWARGEGSESRQEDCRLLAEDPLNHQAPEKQLWGRLTGSELSPWGSAQTCHAGGCTSGFGAQGRRSGLEADAQESGVATECIEVKEMAQERGGELGEIH